MTFQLDTTGGVCAPVIDGVPKWSSPVLNVGEPKRWSDLDAFTQGYVEALFADIYAHISEQAHLASQHGDKTPVGDLRGYCEDKVWSRHFAEQADALAFSDLAPETLARVIADCEGYAEVFPASSRTGEDGRTLWASRQANMWFASFPPLTVQLGDDGKVRFA